MTRYSIATPAGAAVCLLLAAHPGMSQVAINGSRGFFGNVDAGKALSFRPVTGSGAPPSSSCNAAKAVGSSTNATPIVVTSNSHGFNGDVVTIYGHLTDTAANGTWMVGSATANTFALCGYWDGSTCQAPAAGNGVGAATGFASSQVGRLYFRSDATAGQNLYMCTDSTGSPAWVQQLNSGGGGGLADDGVNGVLNRSGANATTQATATQMSAPAICATTGTANAYICAPSPAIGSYVTGTLIRAIANFANTGAATIAVSGLAAKSITKNGSTATALASGDIGSGQTVDLVYDGTQFEMQSQLGNAATGGGLADSGVNGILNRSGANATTQATATQMSAPLNCTTTGSANTYVCAPSPAIASYVSGTHIRMIANFSNTGAALINVSSLGTKGITKNGITATALASGDIGNGQAVDLVYDGTQFEMQSPVANVGSAGGGYATVQGNGAAQTQRATVNFVGGGVVASDVGGATTQVSVFDPISTSYVFDDFECNQIGTGSTGCRSWYLNSAGTLQNPVQVAGFPGLLELTTGATINTIAQIALHQGGMMAVAETFRQRWLIQAFNPGTGAPNVRVGLNNSNAVPAAGPANGIYVEHCGGTTDGCSGADTNWFCVTSVSGTPTRVDTGVAYVNTKTAIQVERVDSTHIGCRVASTIGGLASATLTQSTGTLPTNDMVPVIQLINTVAATAKLELDFFDQLITGLAR